MSKRMKDIRFHLILLMLVAVALIMVMSWHYRVDTYAMTTTNCEENLTFMGNFKVTAYCPCRKCNGKNAGKTASGATPTVGRTIAANKKDFDFGDVVVIDGVEYVVEDRGVKKGCIDLYMDSHSEALKWGIHHLDVYLKGEE